MSGAVTTRKGGAAPLAGLSQARLAWLQATHRRGWAATLWIALSSAIALILSLPVLEAMGAESGLAQTLAHGGGLTVQQKATTIDGFAAFQKTAGAMVAAQAGQYFAPGSAFATAGPVHLASLNDNSVAPAAAAAALAAGYREHLASHIDLVQGQIPPEGLGGGETAVTMPQAGADQLGLHLSDRFCVDVGTGPGRQAGWCGRLVGLWRPLDPRDPYWGSAAPRLEFAMGRYDFFQLVGGGSPGAVAGLRYVPVGASFEPTQTTAAAASLKQLSAQLAATPGLAVSTQLGTALEQFAARRAAVSSTISLFGTAAALVAIFAVALIAARFMAGQSRDISVLRARGWPALRLWLLGFRGLAVLALCAIPAGVALAAVLSAALSLASGGVTPADLRSADVWAAAPSASAAAAALLLVLIVVAGRSAPGSADSSLEVRSGRAGVWWLQTGAALLLACAGLLLLAASSLPATAGLASRLPFGPQGAVLRIPVLALVLLAAAAAALIPVTSLLTGRGVPGSLAAWQIARVPEQHVGVTLVLILATAVAVFGAAGLVLGPAGVDLPADASSLRFSLRASLVVGASGSVLLALVAFGLHYVSTGERRLREYAGLFSHGLPAAQLARSLRAEQAATIIFSVAVGALLGVGLALSALQRPGTVDALVPAAAAVAICVVAVTVGGLVAGSESRRLLSEADPFGTPG